MSVPNAYVKHDDNATNLRINEIRDKVDAWRKQKWHGVTTVTRELLEYWTHDARNIKLYWAQIEAIETIIYLHEIAKFDAPNIIKSIAAVNADYNDDLPRIATKMATGTGKTVVMAMIIAWQTCNSRFDSKRFAKQFVVITPGLVIRERLKELQPKQKNNIYLQMDLVPSTLFLSVKMANVILANYQSFQRGDTLASIGATSQVRNLLGVDPIQSQVNALVMLKKILSDVDVTRPVIVINDEAHHCYKPGSGLQRDESSLDRHKAALWFRSICLIKEHFYRLLSVHDLSATPKFIERGEKRQDSLFPWTVSDFPLVEAVESGIVKIPRLPVNKTNLSEGVCRYVYENTVAISQDELDPSQMPDTVVRPLDALYRLYKAHFNKYVENGHKIPPVFIIVADSIVNAKAIYDYVAGYTLTDKDKNSVYISGAYDLFSNDTSHAKNRLNTILVHSRMGEDESLSSMQRIFRDEAQKITGDSSQKSSYEVIRGILTTVGKEGKPGEQVRCVISVSMLTEGWDAKNVSHIFGFRKFGTQLLCEQVAGRALRRDDTDVPDWYTKPRFAEIFGVPFEYMFEGDVDGPGPDPPPPKLDFFPRISHEDMAIKFPIVDDYNHHMVPNSDVALDSDKVKPYVIKPPTNDPSDEVLMGVVGQTQLIDPTPVQISLNKAYTDLDLNNSKHRSSHIISIDPADLSLQTVKYRLAKLLVDKWFSIDLNRNKITDIISGKTSLFSQMCLIVNKWLLHPKVTTSDNFRPYWLLLNPNILNVTHNIIESCVVEINGKVNRIQPNFSAAGPGDTNCVSFTASASPDLVYENPVKCQHNRVLCDSKLEVSLAKLLDSLDIVLSWARAPLRRFNWSIPYYFEGHKRKYYPDFIAKLAPTQHDRNGLHVVIETKGRIYDHTPAQVRYASQVWAPAMQDNDLGRWVYVFITDISKAARQIRSARVGGYTIA